MLYAYSSPNAIVSPNPNPSDFKLPSLLGEVKASHKGLRPKTIIHIQDAHCNYSAQRSIEATIDYLNKEYGTNVVALEGGSGGYDLSAFTAIKDTDAREKAVRYFESEGRINGAEAYAILNPGKVRLEGIEDTQLYLKNLAVYRESLKHKDEVDAILKKLSDNLSVLKARAYSLRLKEFDEKRGSYLEKPSELKGYLAYLSGLSRSLNIPTNSFSNLSGLIDSLEAERGIDFQRCEREREALVDRIHKTASQLEIGNLASWAASFKESKIRADEFYLYLLEKGESLGLDTEKSYPNLTRYSHYLKKYNSLDKYKVFEEMRSLEDAFADRLSENPAQKELYRTSNDLRILKLLFSISPTRNDYDHYRKNIQRFPISAIISRMSEAARRYSAPFKPPAGAEKLDAYREEIEDFYVYSLKRDEAFVKNASRFMEGSDSIVLISGGFHTENLKELLEKEGYSYVVILPKFEYSENSRYFYLLSGGVSAIEKAVSENNSGLATAAIQNELGVKVEGEKARDNFRMAVSTVGAQGLPSQVTSARNLAIVDEAGNALFEKQLTGVHLKAWEALDNIKEDLKKQFPGEEKEIEEALKKVGFVGDFTRTLWHGGSMATLDILLPAERKYREQIAEAVRKSVADLPMERRGYDRNFEMLAKMPDFTMNKVVLFYDGNFRAAAVDATGKDGKALKALQEKVLEFTNPDILTMKAVMRAVRFSTEIRGLKVDPETNKGLSGAYTRFREEAKKTTPVKSDRPNGLEMASIYGRYNEAYAEGSAKVCDILKEIRRGVSKMSKGMSAEEKLGYFKRWIEPYHVNEFMTLMDAAQVMGLLNEALSKKHGEIKEAGEKGFLAEGEEALLRHDISLFWCIGGDEKALEQLRKRQIISNETLRDELIKMLKKFRLDEGKELKGKDLKLIAKYIIPDSPKTSGAAVKTPQPAAIAQKPTTKTAGDTFKVLVVKRAGDVSSELQDLLKLDPSLSITSVKDANEARGLFSKKAAFDIVFTSDENLAKSIKAVRRKTWIIMLNEEKADVGFLELVDGAIDGSLKEAFTGADLIAVLKKAKDAIRDERSTGGGGQSLQGIGLPIIPLLMQAALGIADPSQSAPAIYAASLFTWTSLVIVAAAVAAIVMWKWFTGSKPAESSDYKKHRFMIGMNALKYSDNPLVKLLFNCLRGDARSIMELSNRHLTKAGNLRAELMETLRESGLRGRNDLADIAGDILNEVLKVRSGRASRPGAIALRHTESGWTQHILTAKQHDIINMAFKGLWGTSYELSRGDEVFRDFEERINNEVFKKIPEAAGLRIHMQSHPDERLYNTIYEYAGIHKVEFPPRREFMLITHPGTHRDERGRSWSLNLFIPQASLAFLKHIKKDDPDAYREWLDHEVAHILDRINKGKGKESFESSMTDFHPIKRLLQSCDAGIPYFTFNKQDPAAAGKDGASSFFARVGGIGVISFILPESASPDFMKWNERLRALQDRLRVNKVYSGKHLAAKEVAAVALAFAGLTTTESADLASLFAELNKAGFSRVPAITDKPFLFQIARLYGGLFAKRHNLRDSPATATLTEFAEEAENIVRDLQDAVTRGEFDPAGGRAGAGASPAREASPRPIYDKTIQPKTMVIDGKWCAVNYRFILDELLSKDMKMGKARVLRTVNYQDNKLGEVTEYATFDFSFGRNEIGVNFAYEDTSSKRISRAGSYIFEYFNPDKSSEAKDYQRFSALYDYLPRELRDAVHEVWVSAKNDRDIREEDRDSVLGFVGVIEQRFAEMVGDMRKYGLTPFRSRSQPEEPPAEDQTGLIGTWVPVPGEAGRPVYDEARGLLSFQAVNVARPHQEPAMIGLKAWRTALERFRGFKRSGIPEIDDALDEFCKEFKGEALLIEQNDYGICGMGTGNILTISDGLKDDGLALLHEVAHGAIASEKLSVDTIIKHIDGGEAALKDYISQQGEEYRQDDKLRAHYALRLFQRQRWPVENLELTAKIRVLSPNVEANNSLARNRKRVWREGTIDDIRLGDYIARNTVFRGGGMNPAGGAAGIAAKLSTLDNPPDMDINVPAQTLVGDPKQGTVSFDIEDAPPVLNWELNTYNLSDIADRHVAVDDYHALGSFGLQDNISLKIGDAHVLVTDNHNFALPFLVELTDRGVIGKGSRMTHADDHDDLVDNFFAFKADTYRSLPEDRKVEYVISKSNIADWQMPLFKEGIADENEWGWLKLDHKTGEWVRRDSSVARAGGLKEELEKAPQIVDIDIDTLIPLDMALTSAEKAAVMLGVIPQKILARISDIARLTKNAKAITIATSPGFMAQKRALVYVKELLRQIEMIKNVHLEKDIGEYVRSIEGKLFAALQRNRLDIDQSQRCVITSNLLARLISDRFGIPVGGDSAVRIEIIPGYYGDDDLIGYHYWLGVYTGGEEPSLYIDGQYSQFDYRYDGRVAVENYGEGVARHNLRDMRTVFAEELKKSLRAKGLNDSNITAAINYFEEMRAKVGIEHGDYLSEIYDGYMSAENIRHMGLADKRLINQTEGGIIRAFKELRGDLPPEAPAERPGLIGKWVPVSDIEFVEPAPESGRGQVRFKAFNIEDAKKTIIDIEIDAWRASASSFGQVEKTEKDEIDGALKAFLGKFKGECLALESNIYGINGIGAVNMLALSSLFYNNEANKFDSLAVFHEVAHAALLNGDLKIDTVERHIIGAGKALKSYLDRRAYRKKTPEMYHHYALRLLQRQLFEAKDAALTERIHSMDPALAGVDNLETLKHRGRVWEPGSVEDIRKGDYFSAYMTGFMMHYYGNTDIADLIVPSNITAIGRIGWCRGLERNVALEVGDANVLVMDNHNFALPFILDMIRNGVISANASMLHIDLHPDVTVNSRFDVDVFNGLNSEKERLEYLLATTTVESWQDLMVVKGIIDEKRWRWIRIYDSELYNVLKEPLRDGLDGKWVFDNVKTRIEKAALQGGMPQDYDIVDIDIDVLFPLDIKLSADEKKEILTGRIPEAIRKRIGDIALAAKDAKVVTIATSPGYINQDRAIIYVKELIRQMKDIKAAKEALSQATPKSFSPDMAREKTYAREGGWNIAKDLVSYELMLGEIESGHLFENHLLNASVYIDAGCAMGLAPLQALRLNHRLKAFGIDIKEYTRSDVDDLSNSNWEDLVELKANAGERYSFIQGDISAAKTFEGLSRADVITAFNVLQYIDDPIKAFSNLYNQMAKGGALFAAIAVKKSDENSARYIAILQRVIDELNDDDMALAHLIRTERSDSAFTYYIIVNKYSDRMLDPGLELVGFAESVITEDSGRQFRIKIPSYRIKGEGFFRSGASSDMTMERNVPDAGGRISMANAQATDSVSEGDLTNPLILKHIDGGTAFEVDEKKEAVVRIRRDRSNPRAPPIEEHFRSNGTFEKIRKAKDPVLLRQILEKSNFRNLSQPQKEELVRLVQRITMSFILGHVIIGKKVVETDPPRREKDIFAHARTGVHAGTHHLDPTVWTGGILLRRLTVEELAQLLLEETQHVLKKPAGRDNDHGKISGAADPEKVIEHDEEFINSLDLRPASLDEILDSLRNLGIDDDPEGDTIFGAPIGRWLKEHSTFLDSPPFHYEHEQKEYNEFMSVWKIYRPLWKIEKFIMWYARSVGEEVRVGRWVANMKRAALRDRRLQKDYLTGSNGPLAWAARGHFFEQVRQERQGKLFANIDISGMQLADLPIWPVDEEGNVRWGLLDWMTVQGRAPPSEYYNKDTKKVSLRELGIRQPPEGSLIKALETIEKCGDLNSGSFDKNIFKSKRMKLDTKEPFSDTTLYYELNGLVSAGILDVNRDSMPYQYALNAGYARAPPEVKAKVRSVLVRLPARPSNSALAAARAEIGKLSKGARFTGPYILAKIQQCLTGDGSWLKDFARFYDNLTSDQKTQLDRALKHAYELIYPIIELHSARRLDPVARQEDSSVDFEIINHLVEAIRSITSRQGVVFDDFLKSIRSILITWLLNIVTRRTYDIEKARKRYRTLEEIEEIEDTPLIAETEDGPFGATPAEPSAASEMAANRPFLQTHAQKFYKVKLGKKNALNIPKEFTETLKGTIYLEVAEDVMHVYTEEQFSRLKRVIDEKFDDDDLTTFYANLRPIDNVRGRFIIPKDALAGKAWQGVKDLIMYREDEYEYIVLRPAPAETEQPKPATSEGTATPQIQADLLAPEGVAPARSVPLGNVPESSPAESPKADPDIEQLGGMDGAAYLKTIRELAEKGATPEEILRIDGSPKVHGGVAVLEAAKRGLPQAAQDILDEAIELYRQNLERLTEAVKPGGKKTPVSKNPVPPPPPPPSLVDRIPSAKTSGPISAGTEHLGPFIEIRDPALEKPFKVALFPMGENYAIIATPGFKVNPTTGKIIPNPTASITLAAAVPVSSGVPMETLLRIQAMFCRAAILKVKAELRLFAAIKVFLNEDADRIMEEAKAELVQLGLKPDEAIVAKNLEALTRIMEEIKLSLTQTLVVGKDPIEGRMLTVDPKGMIVEGLPGKGDKIYQLKINPDETILVTPEPPLNLAVAVKRYNARKLEEGSAPLRLTTSTFLKPPGPGTGKKAVGVVQKGLSPEARGVAPNGPSPNAQTAEMEDELLAVTNALIGYVAPALRPDGTTVHTVLIVWDEAYKDETTTRTETERLRSLVKRAFEHARGNDLVICRSYKEAAEKIAKMQDADFTNTFIYADPRVKADVDGKITAVINNFIKIELITGKDGSILMAAPAIGYTAYSQLYASLIATVRFLYGSNKKADEVLNNELVNQLTERMAHVVKEMTQTDRSITQIKDDMLLLVQGLAETMADIGSVEDAAPLIEKFLQTYAEQHRWTLPYIKAVDWRRVQEYFEAQRKALAAA